MIDFGSHPASVLGRPATTRLILSSFALGLILMLMPWSGPALWLRPDLILVLLLHWTLREPQRIGGWTAFLLGLLTDCVDSNVLGLHALGYSLCYALVQNSRVRILTFYRLDQTLHLLPLFYLDQAISALFNWGLNQAGAPWLWWLRPFSSALLWIVLPYLVERAGGRGDQSPGGGE